MSARLTAEAGYIDLPATLKLVLMRVCASADEATGLSRVPVWGAAIWAGLELDETREALAYLVERGLLRIVEPGEEPIYQVTLSRESGWEE